MPADTVGEQDLRRIFVDEAVKAVALAERRLFSLCQVSATNAWTNKYYRETNTELIGGTGSSVAGIPRLAPLPYGEVSETLVSSVIGKYGMETLIPEEDILMDAIPVIERHVLRIGRAPSYQISVAIEAAISAGYGNTYPIPVGEEWDSATISARDPVFNLLKAADEMRTDNIDPYDGNTYLVINGTDWVNIASNSKIINHPTWKAAEGIIENGVVAQLCGFKIMIDNVITADTAYLIKKNEALVWKEAQPLKVEQTVIPAQGTKIQAWQYGSLQIPVPNAIVKITNTRA